MPEAPAGLRGGGSTSAGMISTVHTPLPILAETEPKIWPHFWAPSPESETTSTERSVTVRTDTSLSANAAAPTVGSFIAILPPREEGRFCLCSRVGCWPTTKLGTRVSGGVGR